MDSALDRASTPASPSESLRTPSGLRRFLRFGLVGASGVVVNLGLLSLLVEVVHWHYAVASLLAIEASILSNFAGNQFWTWRDQPFRAHALLSFHGVSLVGMVVQWFVLIVGVEFLQLHYLVASAAGIGAATTWNFLANHHFTFADATSPWRRRLTRPILYLASFCLQLLLAGLLSHDWDTFVFQTSTTEFLQDGQTPYETAEEAPNYIWVGTQLPSQALWYAYPPLPLLLMTTTYWPVAFGLLGGPAVGRILIKLPFLLGNLLLASTAHRLVRTAGDPTAADRAQRLERFLLFNPLLIVIATVWGMFEALLCTLLLWSVLSLRAGRTKTAGLAWGAALLLKIFPLYTGPVLLVWLWRRGGFRDAARFFVPAGLIFLLVSLPFAWSHWGGFLEQVFVLHGSRPPGRYGVLGGIYLLLLGLSENFLHGGLRDEALIASIGLFSFAVTGLSLLLLAFAARRLPLTESTLLHLLAVSLFWGVFWTKIISEQYLILPLVLFAVAFAHPHSAAPRSPRILSRYLWLTSIGVTVAGLLSNYHFVVFLPPDVARAVFGTDVGTLVHGLANASGLSYYALGVILQSTAALLALLGILAGLPLAWPLLRDGLRDATHAVPKLLRPFPRFAPTTTAFLLAFLIAIPSFAVGLRVDAEEPPTIEPDSVDGRTAGVLYRVDWHNPSHDPLVRYASWDEASQVPLDGYFDMSSHRMQQDLVTLRETGFDYLLVPFVPSAKAATKSLFRLAAQEGVAVTLAFDLAQAHSDTEDASLPLTPETAEHLRELLAAPIADYWDQPVLLHLGPEHRLALFVEGLDALQPSFDADEQDYVATILAEHFPNTTDAAPASATEWETLAPDAPWRWAYEEAERRVLRHALNFLDPHDAYVLMAETLSDQERLRAAAPPEVSLALGPTYDGVRRIEAAFAESATTQQAWTHLDEAAAKGSHVTTILPAFDRHERDADAAPHAAVQDGRLVYDDRWTQITARQDSHVLIHGWNAFQTASALQPSFDYGDVLARRTTLWLDAFHRSDATTIAPWDPQLDPIPPPTASLEQAGLVSRILLSLAPEANTS